MNEFRHLILRVSNYIRQILPFETHTEDIIVLKLQLFPYIFYYLLRCRSR